MMHQVYSASPFNMEKIRAALAGRKKWWELLTKGMKVKVKSQSSKAKLDANGKRVFDDDTFSLNGVDSRVQVMGKVVELSGKRGDDDYEYWTVVETGGGGLGFSPDWLEPLDEKDLYAVIKKGDKVRVKDSSIISHHRGKVVTLGKGRNTSTSWWDTDIGMYTIPKWFERVDGEDYNDIALWKKDLDVKGVKYSSSFSPHLFSKKAYSSSPFNMTKIRAALGDRKKKQWWNILTQGMRVKVRHAPFDFMSKTDANGIANGLFFASREELKNRVVTLKRKVTKPSGTWWRIEELEDNSSHLDWSPDFFEPLDEDDLWAVLRGGDKVKIKDKKDLNHGHHRTVYGERTFILMGEKKKFAGKIGEIVQDGDLWHLFDYGWSPDWFDRVPGETYDAIWKKDMDAKKVKYSSSFSPHLFSKKAYSASPFNMKKIRAALESSNKKWWEHLSSGMLVKIKMSVTARFKDGKDGYRIWFVKGDFVRVKKGHNDAWSFGRKDLPDEESYFKFKALLYFEPLDEKDLWAVLKLGDHVMIKKDLKASQSKIDALGIKNIDRSINSGMIRMRGWEVELIGIKGKTGKWWQVRMVTGTDIAYDWSPEWFERISGKTYNAIWKKDLDAIGVKYSSSFSLHLFSKKAYSASPFNMKKIRAALESSKKKEWWEMLTKGMRVKVKSKNVKAKIDAAGVGLGQEWNLDEIGVKKKKKSLFMGKVVTLKEIIVGENLKLWKIEESEDAQWSPDFFEPLAEDNLWAVLKAGDKVRVRKLPEGFRRFYTDAYGKETGANVTHSMHKMGGNEVELKGIMMGRPRFWKIYKLEQGWSPDFFERLPGKTYDALWKKDMDAREVRYSSFSPHLFSKKAYSSSPFDMKKIRAALEDSGKKWWNELRPGLRVKFTKTMKVEKLGGIFDERLRINAGHIVELVEHYGPIGSTTNYPGGKETVSDEDAKKIRTWGIKWRNWLIDGRWNPLVFFEPLDEDDLRYVLKIGDKVSYNGRIMILKKKLGSSWNIKDMETNMGYLVRPMNLLRASGETYDAIWKTGEYSSFSGRVGKKNRYGASPFNMTKIRKALASRGRKWWKELIPGMHMKAKKDAIAGSFYRGEIVEFEGRYEHVNPSWCKIRTKIGPLASFRDLEDFEPLDEEDLWAVLKEGSKVRIKKDADKIDVVRDAKNVLFDGNFKASFLHRDRSVLGKVVELGKLKKWSSRSSFAKNSYWNLVDQGSLTWFPAWFERVKGEEYNALFKKDMDAKGVKYSSFSPHLFSKKAYSGRVFDTPFGTKRCYGASPFDMKKIRKALESKKKQWWEMLESGMRVKVKSENVESKIGASGKKRKNSNWYLKSIGRTKYMGKVVTLKEKNTDEDIHFWKIEEGSKLANWSPDFFEPLDDDKDFLAILEPGMKVEIEGDVFPDRGGGIDKYVTTNSVPSDGIMVIDFGLKSFKAQEKYSASPFNMKKIRKALKSSVWWNKLKTGMYVRVKNLPEDYGWDEGVIDADGRERIGIKTVRLRFGANRWLMRNKIVKLGKKKNILGELWWDIEVPNGLVRSVGHWSPDFFEPIDEDWPSKLKVGMNVRVRDKSAMKDGFQRDRKGRFLRNSIPYPKRNADLAGKIITLKEGSTSKWWSDVENDLVWSPDDLESVEKTNNTFSSPSVLFSKKYGSSPFDMTKIRKSMSRHWSSKLKSGMKVRVKNIKTDKEELVRKKHGGFGRMNIDDKMAKFGGRIVTLADLDWFTKDWWIIEEEGRQPSLWSPDWFEPLDEEDLWAVLKEGDEVKIKRNLKLGKHRDVLGDIYEVFEIGGKHLEGQTGRLDKADFFEHKGKKFGWWVLSDYEWSPDFFERVSGNTYDAIWKKDLDAKGVKYASPFLGRVFPTVNAFLEKKHGKKNTKRCYGSSPFDMKKIRAALESSKKKWWQVVEPGTIVKIKDDKLPGWTKRFVRLKDKVGGKFWHVNVSGDKPWDIEKYFEPLSEDDLWGVLKNGDKVGIKKDFVNNGKIIDSFGKKVKRQNDWEDTYKLHMKNVQAKHPDNNIAVLKHRETYSASYLGWALKLPHSWYLHSPSWFERVPDETYEAIWKKDLDAKGVKYASPSSFSPHLFSKKAYSASPFNMTKIRAALSDNKKWWWQIYEGMKVRVKDLPADFEGRIDADGKPDVVPFMNGRRKLRNFIFEINEKSFLPNPFAKGNHHYWMLKGNPNVWSPDFLEPIGDLQKFEKGMTVKVRDYEPDAVYSNAFARDVNGVWTEAWNCIKITKLPVVTIAGVDSLDDKLWYRVVGDKLDYSPDDFEGVVDTDIKVGDLVKSTKDEAFTYRVLKIKKNGKVDVITVKSPGFDNITYADTERSVYYKVDTDGNPILIKTLSKEAYSASPFNMKKIRSALEAKWWKQLKIGMKVRVKENISEIRGNLVDAEGKYKNWSLPIISKPNSDEIAFAGKIVTLDGTYRGGLREDPEETLYWTILEDDNIWVPDWFELLEEKYSSSGSFFDVLFSKKAYSGRVFPTVFGTKKRYGASPFNMTKIRAALSSRKEWWKRLESGMKVRVKDDFDVGEITDSITGMKVKSPSEKHWGKKLSDVQELMSSVYKRRGDIVTLDKQFLWGGKIGKWRIEEGGGVAWSPDYFEPLYEEDLWAVLKQGDDVRVKNLPASYYTAAKDVNGVVAGANLTDEMRILAGKNVILRDRLDNWTPPFWRVIEDKVGAGWSPDFFERVPGKTYDAIWRKDEKKGMKYSASPFDMKKIRAALSSKKKQWWEELKSGMLVKFKRNTNFASTEEDKPRKGDIVELVGLFHVSTMTGTTAIPGLWYVRYIEPARVRFNDRVTLNDGTKVARGPWQSKDYFEPLDEDDLWAIVKKGDRVRIKDDADTIKDTLDAYGNLVGNRLPGAPEEGRTVTLGDLYDHFLGYSWWYSKEGGGWMSPSWFERVDGEDYNDNAIWKKDLDVKMIKYSSGRVFPTVNAFLEKKHGKKNTKNRYSASPFNMTKIRAALSDRKSWWKLLKAGLWVKIKDLPADYRGKMDANGVSHESFEFGNRIEWKGKVVKLGLTDEWRIGFGEKLDGWTLSEMSGNDSDNDSDRWSRLLWSPDFFEPLDEDDLWAVLESGQEVIVKDILKSGGRNVYGELSGAIHVADYMLNMKGRHVKLAGIFTGVPKAWTLIGSPGSWALGLWSPDMFRRARGIDGRNLTYNALWKDDLRGIIYSSLSSFSPHLFSKKAYSGWVFDTPFGTKRCYGASPFDMTKIRKALSESKRAWWQKLHEGMKVKVISTVHSGTEWAKIDANGEKLEQPSFVLGDNRSKWSGMVVTLESIYFSGKNRKNSYWQIQEMRDDKVFNTWSPDWFEPVDEQWWRGLKSGMIVKSKWIKGTNKAFAGEMAKLIKPVSLSGEEVIGEYWDVELFGGKKLYSIPVATFFEPLDEEDLWVLLKPKMKVIADYSDQVGGKIEKRKAKGKAELINDVGKKDPNGKPLWETDFWYKGSGIWSSGFFKRIPGVDYGSLFKKDLDARNIKYSSPSLGSKAYSASPFNMKKIRKALNWGKVWWQKLESGLNVKVKMDLESKLKSLIDADGKTAFGANRFRFGNKRKKFEGKVVTLSSRNTGVGDNTWWGIEQMEKDGLNNWSPYWFEALDEDDLWAVLNKGDLVKIKIPEIGDGVSQRVPLIYADGKRGEAVYSVVKLDKLDRAAADKKVRLTKRVKVKDKEYLEYWKIDYLVDAKQHHPELWEASWFARPPGWNYGALWKKDLDVKAIKYSSSPFDMAKIRSSLMDSAKLVDITGFYVSARKSEKIEISNVEIIDKAEWEKGTNKVYTVKKVDNRLKLGMWDEKKQIRVEGLRGQDIIFIKGIVNSHTISRMGRAYFALIEDDVADMIWLVNRKAIDKIWGYLDNNDAAKSYKRFFRKKHFYGSSPFDMKKIRAALSSKKKQWWEELKSGMLVKVRKNIPNENSDVVDAYGNIITTLPGVMRTEMGGEIVKLGVIDSMNYWSIGRLGKNVNDTWLSNYWSPDWFEPLDEEDLWEVLKEGDKVKIRDNAEKIEVTMDAEGNDLGNAMGFGEFRSKSVIGSEVELRKKYTYPNMVRYYWLIAGDGLVWYPQWFERADGKKYGALWKKDLDTKAYSGRVFHGKKNTKKRYGASPFDMDRIKNSLFCSSLKVGMEVRMKIDYYDVVDDWGIKKGEIVKLVERFKDRDRWRVESEGTGLAALFENGVSRAYLNPSIYFERVEV